MKYWTVVKIFDNRCSVRDGGVEKYILPILGHSHPDRSKAANSIEKMLNDLCHKGLLLSDYNEE